MRIDDPQGFAEIDRAKLQAAVDDFVLYHGSNDVFRLQLYARGFRGARLEDEYRYWEAERYREEKHQKHLSGCR